MIRSSFQNRGPVAAGLVALISPVVGLLYLGRGRLALVYGVVLGVLSAAPFVLAHCGVLDADPRPVALVMVYGIGFTGLVHCVYLARTKRVEPGRWYARWYVPLVIVASVVSLRMGVYTLFEMPNATMAPAITAGDYVVAFYRPTGADTVTPNQLVIFSDPATHMQFVKRVRSVPGATAAATDAELYLLGIDNPLSSAAQTVGATLHDVRSVNMHAIWNAQTRKLSWHRID